MKQEKKQGFVLWLLSFMKREIVFTIALILAILSCFLTHPSKDYISYIDFRVLSLLFCLMAVVNGLSKLGVFHKLGIGLLQRTKTTKSLYIALVYLCFFTSMLITNDVALLTFVPFTILVLSMAGKGSELTFLVIMETIASNLGSMLTPLGNPQNLYLYTISEMQLGDFVLTLLPYSLLSLILLTLILLFHKSEPVNIAHTDSLTASEYEFHTGRFVMYLILFIICLLVVLHILPFYVMLGIVVAAVLIFDRKTIITVDYILLLTFIWFFIFIGNMKQLPAVHNLLSGIISGHEFAGGILISQFISNVPAAILLSGFTDAISPLLIGINVGGLGTLIASMASLISYKLYCKTKDSNSLQYIALFTLYSLIFLACLILEYVCLTHFRIH